MKRIKGIVIGLITSILVLIVMFNVYNFVSINVLKKELRVLLTRNNLVLFFTYTELLYTYINYSL